MYPSGAPNRFTDTEGTENSYLALLETVRFPEDLRALDRDQLQGLVEELRERHIDVVAGLGGHFAASLGVVELTTALHYVFDTPRDQIVWDTGHQAYIHKILTGRSDALPTIRQHGGLAPFLPPGRIRIRHLRGRPRGHLDLRRVGHGGRSGCVGRELQGHCRHR